VNRLAPFLGLALAAAGCSDGIDIEPLCRSLAEQCGDDPDYVLRRQECIDEGLELERAAAEAACEVELDEHIACVDRAECNWNHDCGLTRLRLDSCIQGPR